MINPESAADARREVSQLLSYPFDSARIMRRSRIMRRRLREAVSGDPLRVAILGGSTTSEVRNLLDLFLLADGVAPEFYESQYNKFYEEAVFENAELDAFAPHIVYVHTSTENITEFPAPLDDGERVQDLLSSVSGRLGEVWDNIRRKYGATIIQNNFEPPFSRPLGQLDATAISGKTQFVNRLNERIAEHARANADFLVHDIHYLASWFGLEKWYDRRLWHSFKYAMSLDATPALAHGVTSLIRASLGGSKKCLVCDLDNTLWGGVVGDDGVEGIRLGPGTPEGEAYTDFQQYLRELHDRGIILAVCSKNDEANALEGIEHRDSRLSRDDFAAFRANWMPKDENVERIASEINIGIDSLVFVDDNPVERKLVADNHSSVSVPDIGDDISRYIGIIDKGGYFETTSLSAEDSRRARMYTETAARNAEQARYPDYTSFLRSLEMVADVSPFQPIDLQRIAQLTNKTNQYNLTTRRYSQPELEALSRDDGHVTLSGRLADKYGDNGLVSVILGRVEGEVVHLDLWLMSCRVIKRELEWVMFSELRAAAMVRDCTRLRGYFAPTKKNRMVADHYARLGFVQKEAGADGATVWDFELGRPDDRQEIPIAVRR